MNPAEVHAVYDAKQLGRKTWIWDIALDSHNQPVVVYVVFNKEEDHRYWYSRWDGAEWRHVEICEAGPWFPETPPGAIETEPYYSGGLILDHHDPSHVYLSRCVEGVFEIEHWYTPDHGETWAKEAVTEKSARHNVRPFVSRGHSGRNGLLFWMHGSYTHWTDYDTQIKMVPLQHDRS
ncbi:hypothetical protein MJA45_18220 [Paenibacillus aurantius]|uniref:Uncharacterized protein n=1 Tax=Paenibacillus aurantius TaxID=2918900 RepID=A0AA96L9L9_9BACL|nr:hypothetical protein [Paenibacillus aurantius]WNQ09561.1 hypothetical protein MJA45_18220 [Paenibacillus aurantius]